MQFNHDNMIGVRLAEELVNLHVDERWEPEPVASALATARVRLDGMEAELGAMRDWAERLLAVFAASEEGERCRRIDALLAVGVRQVSLTTHDDLPPHLHFVGDDESVGQRVRALTIGGLAIFAVEARAGRMGLCGRPGCGRAYVDTSRNGRRAYCSALCGNNHAVQRYRDRGARVARG